MSISDLAGNSPAFYVVSGSTCFEEAAIELWEDERLRAMAPIEVGRAFTASI